MQGEALNLNINIINKWYNKLIVLSFENRTAHIRAVTSNLTEEI